MNEIKELIDRSDLAVSCGLKQEAVNLLRLARKRYVRWFLLEASSQEKLDLMSNQFETNLMLKIEKLEESLVNE